MNRRAVFPFRLKLTLAGALLALVPLAIVGWLLSLFRMRTIVLGTLGVVLLLALFVAFVVAKQITRPIEALSSFARDLAARRFDRRVTIETRDELGMLGDAMSHAAADLEASEARIAEEVAIRIDLGRYLPAEIVEAVVKREQDMELGGKRRTITVLFADVVGFTPITDHRSPRGTSATARSPVARRRFTSGSCGRE